jgi:hypothetical protein
MDTAKIYHDSEGNECTIGQMIEREPYWAANRLQEGEAAIERVKLLEKGICVYVREEVESYFENDAAAIAYFESFALTEFN